MNYTLEEEAHYKYLQERLEQWQTHHFEQELLGNVKSCLTRVNWHKNILLNKHSQISQKSLRSLLNGFEKEIYNLEDLQRKLRLINSKSLRCKAILSKTKQLQLLTLKFINDEQKRTT